MYKFKKIVGRNDFSYLFRKIIIRTETKEYGTTGMLCDRLQVWWLIQPRLTTLQTSLIARRCVGPQTQ